MLDPLTRRDLTRVVVAVDPAVTSGDSADDTGIIVAGLGRDGDGYILADYTCHLSPDGWARQVKYAYDVWSADRVVAEVNNGGDLVATVLRTVDPGLPVKSISAHTGKYTRAEPIAALFEQGRVHLVGSFPELEDQLTTWVPRADKSPDRLDAMVWSLTELMTGVGVSAPLISKSPSRARIS